MEMSDRTFGGLSTDEVWHKVKQIFVSWLCGTETRHELFHGSKTYSKEKRRLKQNPGGPDATDAQRRRYLEASRPNRKSCQRLGGHGGVIRGG